MQVFVFYSLLVAGFFWILASGMSVMAFWYDRRASAVMLGKRKHAAHSDEYELEPLEAESSGSEAVECVAAASDPREPLQSRERAGVRSSSRLDRAARLSTTAGVLVLATLVAWLWFKLERPPLRTLGETRLWYALLLPVIGLLVEWRLKTRALRLPMLAMGLVFLGINLFEPELLDRTLMPALQSPWFIPHVVVYMFAYAALGLAAGVSIWVLLSARWLGRAVGGGDLRLAVLLVRLGFPFLTLGLCFGAIWGKEAWGHYWSWDPKETWALVSWLAYLCVIHTMVKRSCSPRGVLWLIATVFLPVLGCWFLVNYLPAAASSVHSYVR